MTAADLVHRLLPVGALEHACWLGRGYLRDNGHRPAAEVLDECLATTAGCSWIRWLAVQTWGQRADDAIHRGHLRCMAEEPKPGEPLRLVWREETTREVAEWLRAEIGGAS